MDWLTFLSKVIDSVIWPALVFVVCLYFKEPIFNLLGNIKSVSHKDTRIDFSDKVGEVVEESGGYPFHVPYDEVQYDDQYSDELKKIQELANVDVSSAVLYVWGYLEKAMRDVYNQFFGNESSCKIVSIVEIERVLLANGFVYPSFKGVIKELRFLRNKIAHGEVTDVTYDDAIDYAGLVLSIVIEINHIKEQKIDEKAK